jgi:hypothetical protein
MPSRSIITSLMLLAASGCAAGAPRSDASAQESQPPEAPWEAAPLAPIGGAALHLRQWERAENRTTCEPLAPAALGAGEGATARAASFSGGWGVAYDLPALRSAFGVAGAGVLAAEPSYDAWPYTRRWRDGSTAGYGPEGGTGPNQLAYLRIPGQRCLYNVWSRLGRDHLEFILEQLRYVAHPGR